MPIKILMPALSPTMTEGTLASWLKSEGDDVSAGDVIAEIETDKATMEVEAVDEGKLGKILVEAGTEGVAVNEVIAMLLEEGEDASALDGADSSPAPAPAAAPEPAAAPKAEAPAAAPAPAAPAPAAPSQAGNRVFASPLARRMAAQAGLDLSAIKGTGPNGRIVKADVEAASAGGTAAAPAPAAAPKATEAPAAAASMPTGPDAKALADAYGMTYTEQPNSGMRKVIAKRLTESKQTVPHFYLTVECELDALLAMRKQLNAKSPEGEGAFKLSVNDLIIKACAIALKRVPAANASYTDAAMLMYDHADISVAVATPSGLITPIIKRAEEKGLSTISREMKDLAGRARDGKLKPEEYQGGTFSVSNLGMFGIKEFAAIINPPQGCILAVGAGEQRPVVKDGALAVATVMSCTLSVDHRVVDGAVGAEYLAEFKKLIEDPMAMML
ncbi:MAG: pyruvate dehydrogenase complex dihydrolipoamide acetyltransferase [Alphaproteobacteria bacterium]|nr:pyruvate dehydrogenase complex dihydrolipoamide acetyltransferase [Alphaproteobacteria bacterium SS10]